MAWAKGTQINGYTIDSELGKGGFGITYKAKKRFGNKDQWVVLKTINDRRRGEPAYPQHIELFKQEVTVMGELLDLKHNHMASVYDFCDDGQWLYCVIQFIDGENLKKRVERKGKPLPELEALLYIQQIGEALDALHKKGKIHRDAHPQNIMISDGQAVLIDFGLVCSIEPTGSIFIPAGCPGFAPGEQFSIEGQKNHPYQEYNRQPTVDIYTLASSLYYALTAENPDHNRNIPPKQRNSKISQRVNDAIVQARQPDPRKRPQNISEWFDLLGLQKSSGDSSQGGTRDVSGGLRSFSPWFGGLLRVVALARVFVGNTPEDSASSARTTSVSPTPAPSPSAPPPPITHLGIAVEPYSYTTVRTRVLANKEVEVTREKATSPIGKYKETALNLPSSAVPLEMVAIPGGTFKMGSIESEVDRKPDEGPQHRVSVPAFFMGRYEITQAQYEAVMGNNPTTGKAWMWDGSKWVRDTQIPAKFLGQDKPVVGVTWDEAQEFCEKLSELTGKPYRLPTEAEWEYAARSGTTTPFSYGDTITSKVANYHGNYPYIEGQNKDEYRGNTIEVNKLYPNAWGLYQMHGNVWEWVEDQYHNSYKDKPRNQLSDGSIPWVTNTNVLADDDLRVLRGGSWSLDARYLRSAFRDRDYRAYRNTNHGFRVVVGGL